LRILIDCRFWGTKHTGLGRYTENLVTNLLKIDKKNEYILLSSSKNNIIIEQYGNITVLPVNAAYYSLKEQLVLPKLIHKLKPDLIHFPHFNVPILTNFPFVVTIHDLIKHHSRGRETTTHQALFYWTKFLGYKLVFRKAVYKAKKIIVPSNFVKRELKKIYHLPEENIKVVYEGVSNKFKINPPSLSWRSGEKLKIGKQKLKILKKIKKPYLLYVGNLYPHKNIRRLILAIKLLNQFRRINLVIVCGRDVFWRRIKNAAVEFKAEKFISLPGFAADKDLAVLYAQAEAFVSPSLIEGFGLPGLEAMVLGCPVICSNIPTFKEIYGKSAYYFNPRDIDDIKDKILHVLNFSFRKRQVMIKKGLFQASKYSWQECAQETLEVYQGIVNNW